MDLFDFLWIRAVCVDLGGFQSIRLDLCRLGLARKSLFLLDLEEFVELV